MSATITQAARRTSLVLPLVALAAGLGGLAVIFLPECRAALKVWGESTAYGHCYLIAFMSAYLAWDRRESLRGLLPRPTPAFLLLGLPLPFAWFAAERLGLMEGRQFVMLGFVELLFLVVLGRTLFRALLAPLAYLFFLVPSGAFLTPVLQTITAHFIDVGLSALGIPHFVSDMLIEVPAGTFFVAEACAGLRFLIAAVAFGVFYALLNYRKPGRRLVFIGASIAVPIVANGFRALGIVVLGQVLGSAEAAAADHLVYGWVFFSIVMLLLVAAGLPMREPPAGPRRAPAPAAPGAVATPWPAALVLVLAAIAPLGAAALDRAVTPGRFAAAPALAAPEGCTATPDTQTAEHAAFVIACGDHRWTVALQVLPPRSTGAAMADARGRLVGAIGAEDTTIRPLANAPPQAGTWQVVVSRDPTLITGLATWIRGEPARGGIRQRLLQARDSVLGNDVPPLLMAISTRPPRRMTETELTDTVAELVRILDAQGDLNAAALRLTAP